MERLTHRIGEIDAVPTTFDLDFVFEVDDNVYKGLTDIFNKLAAYEDAEEQGRVFDPIQVKGIELALEELKEYRELKKQGRLVVLLCKVGDSLYWIREDNRGFGDMEVIGERILSISINGYDNRIHFTSRIISQSDIGKIVFLTREAAEVALNKKTNRKEVGKVDKND